MTNYLSFRQSILGLLLFLFAAMPLGSAHADDPQPTLETIIKAWKDREKKTESFDFRWWNKKSEALDPHPPPTQGRLRDSFNSIPRPENKSIWRHRFTADAKGRYLFEEFGHEWLPDKGDFIPKHIAESYDGSLVKVFNGKGKLDHSTVRILEKSFAPDTGFSMWADPIKIAFRPLTAGIGVFDANKLVLAKESETIENIKVLILGDENRTVYVDPAKDYLPIQYTSTSGDTRIVITYQPDDIVGWVPGSWTIRCLGDTATATIMQYSINKPIPDADLEFDLREGAILQDNRTRPITTSIIYPDGKQRVLKREEHSKTFEELLKTEPKSE